MDNTSKDFQELISNIDSEDLQKGLKTVSEIVNTEEGKKLLEIFKNIDKDTLVNKLNETNKTKAFKIMNKQKISSKLSNLDKEEIVKKLKENPQLIDKIKNFLNN